MRKEFFIGFDERTMEDEERNQQRVNGTSGAAMDARNLLRQFKNIGNYLRLLFDPDVYGLCKLYTVMEVPNHRLFLCLPFVAKAHLSARRRA